MKTRLVMLIGMFLAGVCGLIAQPDHAAYYLGVLADRAAVDQARENLIAAGAPFADAAKNSILFAIDEKTCVAPLLRELALFRRVFAGLAEAIADPEVAGNPMLAEFVRLSHRMRVSPKYSLRGVVSAVNQATQGKASSKASFGDISNDNVTGIDAVLADGGIITGKVTNSAGQPVKSIVRVFDSARQYIASGWTRSVESEGDGTYAVQGLRIGTYKVYFVPSSGNYLPQWYANKSSFESANSVSVTEKATAANIDAILGPGGIISGRVTNSAGAAVRSISVQAYDAARQFSAGSIKTSITDSFGEYTIQGLPAGSYKVRFFPVLASNYVPQWYSNLTSFDSAQAVGVTTGSTTANINAILLPGGTISGRVTDSTGDALQQVAVWAYSSIGQYSSETFVKFSQTNINGDYSLIGLPAGSYKIIFMPLGNYLAEWYDNKETFDAATPVSVTAGSTTSNINAVLDPGGTITGTVTDASGAPLQDVTVTVNDPMKDVSLLLFLSGRIASTDSSGNYSLEGLPAGNYRVHFEPASGNLLPEWYNDKSQAPKADRVTVTAGQTTSDVDAVLDPGNTISGSVTNVAGIGIKDVHVSFYNLNRISAHFAATDNDGNYTGVGLPDGAYKIEFAPDPDADHSGNYLGKWYDEKMTFETADIIYLGTFISIIAPSGLEQWGAGTTQNITWIAQGVTGTATIELWKDEAFAATIGTAEAAAGVFAWKIPQSQQNGSGYKIRVFQGDIESFSGEPFAIGGGTGASIHVTAPNGGEQWQTGTVHNIVWTQSGLSGSVTLQLYKSGSLVSTLGTAAATAGTYAWTIASSQGGGSDYKIRVFQGSVEDYSDANFALVSGSRKHDFLGSWSGDAVYSRNSDTGAWTRITSAATQIAAGDMDGDGKDDVIGNWSGNAVWVQYSSTGQWENLTSAANWIAAGDLNGDGKADLIGIWGTILWVRDSASASWTSITTGATQVAAGDLDGDGKADLIGVWPGALWARYSSTGQWTSISSAPDWITAADVNGDGKADLLGIWGGAIYVRDSASGSWTSVTSGANKVVAGDLDGDGKADLIGNWPGTGVWVQYTSTGAWQRLSGAADSIATGRLR